MGRPAGARIWTRVLSELAQVTVVVEWERPAWRVRWQDGPTLRALTERAAALSGYRVASALPFAELRFTRSDSRVAVALAWLALGSPASVAAARAAVGEVEAFCADTGYPQMRFDDPAIAAADLLSRLAQGDITEMGALLAQAHPRLPPHRPLPASIPDLPGRVESYRWPSGGPPEELLGPAIPVSTSPVAAAVVCQHCGQPLATDGPRRGRPPKYCSGACRTAAHRAHQREVDPASA